MDQPQSATVGFNNTVQTEDAKIATTFGEIAGRGVPISLVGLLRLFWACRRIIFQITSTGLLLSLLIALVLPVTYTSTTTLMPPESFSNSSNLNLTALAGPAAGFAGMLEGKSPGDLFVAILQSRTVQERLIARFGLLGHYRKSRIEDTCKQLEQNTSLSEDSKSGVITIRVTAKNPLLASQIAKAYVEELDRVVTQSSTSAARRERIFLEERLKTNKQDLDDDSKAFSQFASANTAMDIPAQSKDMMDAEVRLQGDLIAGQTELAGLRKVYSEDNIRVRAAEARLAALRQGAAKISGESNSADSGIGNMGSLYPSLRELPALGLTYSDMRRRIDAEEALWESMTKQYEMAKVEEAKEIPTVSVLDAANMPERKSGPPRSIIVVFGTFLSLIAAAISALAISFWEGMDVQDERKKLLAEIGATTVNSLHWLRRVPLLGKILRGSDGYARP